MPDNWRDKQRLCRQRRELIVSAMNKSSSSSSDDEDTPVRKKRVRKRTPQRKGVALALSSGVLAAIAGTFGKLAMNQAEVSALCEEVLNFNFRTSSPFDALSLCDSMSYYIRGVCFLVMILLNAVMWTTFVKALRYCKTSLEATVTNTAANFFSSAIVGQLVFEESVSLMWWMGTILIVFGLALMNFGGKLSSETMKERRKKFKMS